MSAALPPPVAHVSTHDSPHYRWGEDCDGWYLDQADQLCVIEERLCAGCGESWHVHERTRQFFYVLQGTARMSVADQPDVLFGTGQGLAVPPGLPHRILNDSATSDLRLLVISAPSTRNDRTSTPAPTRPRAAERHSAGSPATRD